MRPLLIIGGGGLLLWYLNSKGYLSMSMFTGSTTPATTTPGTTTGTTTPPASTAPAYNSLAATFARMKADAGAQAASTGLSAYGWNYSLARVSNITPPNPVDVFTSGMDLSQNMTADQYWGVMAPYLTANMGLSGVRSINGLGATRRMLLPVGYA